MYVVVVRNTVVVGVVGSLIADWFCLSGGFVRRTMRKD